MRGWALLVAACGGSGDSPDSLAERVEELEAQLDADNAASTGVDEALGSSTTIDELRPELVRKRFESALSASVEKASEVADSGDRHIEAYDPSICGEMTSALDSHLAAFGWDDTANRDLKPVRDQVCNDVATVFEIAPDFAYDIERTDSIISPFVATATIPMSATNSWTGSSGRAILEPIVSSVNVTLHWAYQDGEWVLKEVESELASERLYARR